LLHEDQICPDSALDLIFRYFPGWVRKYGHDNYLESGALADMINPSNPFDLRNEITKRNYKLKNG
jgi:hypothetical protein